MAGLLCLFGADASIARRDCAARLARMMVFFPHQAAHLEQCCDGGVILGVVLNQRSPAARNRFLVKQGDLACAVEGHIADVSEACGAVNLLRAERYAEAVLAVYASHGANFARVLKGQFNAVVVDAKARVVVAANGRHAQSSLYVHEGVCGGVIATALGPLGACGLFNPRLDHDAVLTFLAYGQLFGQRSLLEDVTVLDGASVAEWYLDLPGSRRRRYWEYCEIGPKLDRAPMNRLVDELCALLEASADRMVRRSGRLVSGLSGGNDSRLVTGLAARRRSDLKAWTFGTPGSLDLTVAAQVCKKLRIEHLVFPLEPPDLAKHAADFVSVVDGSMTAAHAFFLPRAAQLGTQADVVLNGYGGDYLLQGGLLDLGPRAVLARARHGAGQGRPVPHPHLERNRSRDSIVGYIAARYGHLSPLAPLLLPGPPDFWEIVEAEIDRSAASVPPEYQVEHWGFENRGRRWTMLGSFSDRHFYGDDCIYYDDELFDRCLAAPPALRRGNRLHNVVVTRLLPDIAGIISANTGLPANSPAWRVTMHKAVRLVRRRILGRDWTYASGMDLETWARTVQRPFYLELLADQRTQGRSFWDARALRSRYGAHFEGQTSFGRAMGLVATIELFARRWVDYDGTKRGDLQFDQGDEGGGSPHVA